GAHGALRSVQPRPADLDANHSSGARPAVSARPMTPADRGLTKPLYCLCLTGPTATGKTELALALARHVPLEIVSMDSAMVYRGLDIGTAKPSPATRAAVPHHLIDILEPTEAYSAGR